MIHFTARYDSTTDAFQIRIGDHWSRPLTAPQFSRIARDMEYRRLSEGRRPEFTFDALAVGEAIEAALFTEKHQIIERGRAAKLPAEVLDLVEGLEI